MNKHNIVLVGIPGYEQNVFPLGIYSLKAYLLKHLNSNSLNVDVLTFRAKSCQITPNRLYFYPKFTSAQNRTILTKIIKNHPLIVGFSCFTWNIKTVFKIVKLVKQRDPSVNIVLGGPEASYYAKKIVRSNKNVDYVIVDEGEKSFTELVKYIIYKQSNIANIDGICYRNNNRIVLKIHQPVLNLNDLPSPYLMNFVNLEKEKNVVIETSRGCPFKCAYCSYNIRNYARIRFFPLKKAKNELIYTLDKNVREIHIIDDNFNISEARAIELLKTIIRHNRKTSVKLFVRADVWLLSEEIVELLKKSTALLLIGVQSLNQKTLRIAKRISNKKILEQNLKMFDKFNIPYELQFIIGLPGDRYQDIKNDIDWALSFNVKRVALQILRVNPDTYYQKRAVELGLKYPSVPPYRISKSNTMSGPEIKKAYLLSKAVDYFINQHPYKEIVKKACQKQNYFYSDFFVLWLKKQKIN